MDGLLFVRSNMETNEFEIFNGMNEGKQEKSATTYRLARVLRYYKTSTVLPFVQFHGSTVLQYLFCVSIYLHYAVLVVSEVDSIVVVNTFSYCGNSIQGTGVIVSYAGLAGS